MGCVSLGNSRQNDSVPEFSPRQCTTQSFVCYPHSLLHLGVTSRCGCLIALGTQSRWGGYGAIGDLNAPQYVKLSSASNSSHNTKKGHFYSVVRNSTSFWLLYCPTWGLKIFLLLDYYCSFKLKIQWLVLWCTNIYAKPQEIGKINSRQQKPLPNVIIPL
jgi:hypothetical protein